MDLSKTDYSLANFDDNVILTITSFLRPHHCLDLRATCRRFAALIDRPWDPRYVAIGACESDPTDIRARSLADQISRNLGIFAWMHMPRKVCERGKRKIVGFPDIIFVRHILSAIYEKDVIMVIDESDHPWSICQSIREIMASLRGNGDTFDGSHMIKTFDNLERISYKLCDVAIMRAITILRENDATSRGRIMSHIEKFLMEYSSIHEYSCNLIANVSSREILQEWIYKENQCGSCVQSWKRFSLYVELHAANRIHEVGCTILDAIDTTLMEQMVRDINDDEYSPTYEYICSRLSHSCEVYPDQMIDFVREVCARIDASLHKIILQILIYHFPLLVPRIIRECSAFRGFNYIKFNKNMPYYCMPINRNWSNYEFAFVIAHFAQKRVNFFRQLMFTILMHGSTMEDTGFILRLDRKESSYERTEFREVHGISHEYKFSYERIVDAFALIRIVVREYRPMLQRMNNHARSRLLRAIGGYNERMLHTRQWSCDVHVVQYALREIRGIFAQK